MKIIGSYLYEQEAGHSQKHKLTSAYEIITALTRYFNLEIDEHLAHRMLLSEEKSFKPPQRPWVWWT